MRPPPGPGAVRVVEERQGAICDCSRILRGTRAPVFPPGSRWRPPDPVATTGLPAAPASISATGVPSFLDVSNTRCKPRRASADPSPIQRPTAVAQQVPGLELECRIRSKPIEHGLGTLSWRRRPRGIRSRPVRTTYNWLRLQPEGVEIERVALDVGWLSAFGLQDGRTWAHHPATRCRSPPKAPAADCSDVSTSNAIQRW